MRLPEELSREKMEKRAETLANILGEMAAANRVKANAPKAPKAKEPAAVKTGPKK